MQRTSNEQSSGRWGLRLVAAAWVIGCLLATSPARAEATPEQVAAAETLYREAWRLMQEGKHAEACPKLEESQKLDAGMGTLLLLAECYERTNRPASAWAHYVEIAGQERKRPRAD